MQIRHLRPSDYRVMPWKNGLGTTTEIAVDPPGAGLDDFAWRLSIADLAASGPFSTFPGIERIILQTEGEPMELVHEGRGGRRLALLSPYRFDGAWPTHGELGGTPARDFNIMARRSRFRPSAAVHSLARGSRVRLCLAAETQIVHAFRGTVAIRVDGSDTAADLLGAETLIVEGQVEIEVAADVEEAVVFVVALDGSHR
ncbi:HutD/Ves family protein [Polyangium jinanense]|uniref:HutD family protein n=1 Tax=Polyangium jinanense TaxID=2829994 RepID=A0A9X3X2F8_9BACT|nr:HutD family protein [Polyangium jinanense]MDC3955264.1 HutD family protein [Polyangium jinanense]MDC3981565.1 HutD family protein [Polyangium jinanense]